MYDVFLSQFVYHAGHCFEKLLRLALVCGFTQASDKRTGGFVLVTVTFRFFSV